MRINSLYLGQAGVHGVPSLQKACLRGKKGGGGKKQKTHVRVQFSWLARLFAKGTVFAP